MRFWRRGSVALMAVACGVASGQAPQPKPAGKIATARKANELTLAGLRPGRDSKSHAMQLYRKPNSAKDSQDGQLSWAECQTQTLTMDIDAEGKIQVIRATAVEDRGVSIDCNSVALSQWKTGHGLRVGDAATKVIQLYGQPDSRSPSTKDGQPLELWYYAFDWAGPDVPQVMEIVCTKEKDGEAGRVVEITLAAPSL
jgi:hypothetical protein